LHGRMAADEIANPHIGNDEDRPILRRVCGRRVTRHALAVPRHGVAVSAASRGLSRLQANPLSAPRVGAMMWCWAGRRTGGKEAKGKARGACSGLPKA